MDLYLSKDGRSSLIEVKKVTINNVSRVDDYTVTYTDENGDEKEIFVVDLLNAMKNQYIEMTTQIKTEEELDVIPAEDADNAE